MNRHPDWLDQAQRDLEKAKIDSKSQEAIDAAQSIIKFCQDHIAGS